MKKYLLALAVITLASCSKENLTEEQHLNDYVGLYAGEYTIENNSGKSFSSTKNDTILSVSKSEEKNCLVVNDIYFTPNGSILSSPIDKKRGSTSLSIYFRKKILYITESNNGEVLRIQLKETQH